LGEVYATLTGLPLRPRITGRDGIAVLEQIRDRLTLVSLTELEYFAALESTSDTIVGAAAYDALIAHLCHQSWRRYAAYLEHCRNSCRRMISLAR
jgi:hypothetical protein